MNKTLEISAMQYDFHTLLKVSDICGLTGEISFHDTDTGYLVSFPDDDGKAEQRMAERGEVDADLVRAAGARRDTQERVPVPLGEHGVVRDGRLAVR